MISFKNKKVIIWDWNGTLLDDVNYCVDCINILLKNRNIPTIEIETYKEIFTFPIIDYYKAVGFDLEAEGFEKPAMEFINLYYSNFSETSLFPSVPEVLATFRKRGYRQVVLSAMEHSSLLNTLKSKGILTYFDEVTGIGDHYGSSKEETGKKLLEKLDINPNEALIIGDTLHDKQVANSLKIDFALISTGHNSKRRLLQESEVVLDRLDEVLKFVR